MLKPKTSRITTVIRPRRPSVAMKAKDSGTPAKFEATPEKVITALRSAFGRPPWITAAASRKPMRQPSSAVMALIFIDT